MCLWSPAGGNGWFMVAPIFDVFVAPCGWKWLIHDSFPHYLQDKIIYLILCPERVRDLLHLYTARFSLHKIPRSFLVDGFNPFEKCWSNWIISPGRGKNKNIWNHQLVFCVFYASFSHFFGFRKTPKVSRHFHVLGVTRRFFLLNTSTNCFLWFLWSQHIGGTLLAHLGMGSGFGFIRMRLGSKTKPGWRATWTTWILVDGWTNPFEKYYSSQIGSNWIISPGNRGENEKIFELPPPRI